jgi:hypothetical protein
VERLEEKILLDLVHERIVLRKKYRKLLYLLLFFAMYSATLLIRRDGTASYAIESRFTAALSLPFNLPFIMPILRLCTSVVKLSFDERERRSQLHLQQRQVLTPANRSRRHHSQRRGPRSASDPAWTAGSGERKEEIIRESEGERKRGKRELVGVSVSEQARESRRESQREPERARESQRGEEGAGSSGFLSSKRREGGRRVGRAPLLQRRLLRLA